MFKKTAMTTTLVHLLVALSLVNESDQWPGCLGGSDRPVAEQKERLLKKLTERKLVDVEIFRYFQKVQSKKEVTIGETNVEQLMELYSIESANCRDGSFARRRKICVQANSEEIPNISYYCEWKLEDLVRLCKKERTSNEARPTDVAIDQDTVDFFKSLFKDTGSRKLNGSEMRQLFIGMKRKHLGGESMQYHCLVLMCSGRQSGLIGGAPAEQSDGNELDSQQPMWINAYDFCDYYY